LDSIEVKLSKTLAYWLRHRPDIVGLELNSSGWADIDAVIGALHRQGIAADREAIIHVVEANDKRRFQISSDETMIRARQGHSISVDGDWVPAVPSGFLWHGTADRFLASILREGLKPMSRHHVHLSSSYETAASVGARRGNPAVLTVNAKALADGGQLFWLSGNGVWLTNSVPPTALWLHE
jgi:putative RNA 2'-phosphotransferase